MQQQLDVDRDGVQQQLDMDRYEDGVQQQLGIQGVGSTRTAEEH